MALKRLRRPAQWMFSTPAGVTVCRQPTAHGRQTGFLCSGFPFHIGAAGVRTEFNIKPLLEAPHIIFFVS